MKKRQPSKPGHGCGIARTQLAQLKEFGACKKPHFSGKLLLRHF